MTLNDLKLLFESFCQKETGSPEKKLFGIEYENFVMVPTNNYKGGKFHTIAIDGDSGVYSVLDNLVELTKNSDNPMEKVFENDMLLSLKSSSGSKITIEPGGQIELSDAPRSSLSEASKSLKKHIKLLDRFL